MSCLYLIAEMMRALEQKDDEIHRERDEHRLLHSQMDLVTHIYNGQHRHLQDVEQEIDILRDTIHNMEEEDERKTQDNNHLREITEVQGRHVYQLRRTITEKDRQLCDKCSRLRDLEDTKGEYESVIKRQRLTIKEKKDQLNEKSATINELKVETNEQSATINELKVETNEQSATINELKVETNEQSATINELKVETNELKVENNELKVENNEQSATINELQVENNEQSATINEQSATVNDLIEQNHDRCKTINDLAEENNNKTKENDELKKKVNVEVYVSQTKEEIIAEQSQIIEEQKAQLEEQREMIKRYRASDREIKKEQAQQAIVNQDLYDQLEDVKKLCK
jgi:DNA repair exonuclease SbcCD ATPase subunit